MNADYLRAGLDKWRRTRTAAAMHRSDLGYDEVLRNATA